MRHPGTPRAPGSSPASRRIATAEGKEDELTYTKPLIEREKALEGAFFRERNARLLETLQARHQHAERQTALATALGVADQATLAPLLALGVRAENVAALVLAPLVAVAWADHQLESEERRAILAAEAAYGIDPASEAGRLIHGWLEARPHDSLLEAWSGYVKQLCRVLQPAERERLRSEIVGRSNHVVRTLERAVRRGHGAGRAELAVLARIEAAFAGSQDAV